MVRAFVDNRDPQLPVTMPIGQGEAGASFLSRLAEANWYRDGSWIRELVSGPTGPDVWWTHEQIERLASICGLPATCLEPSFRIRRGSGIAYIGDILSIAQVERVRFKICPSCLIEFGYHHAAFDLASVAVCPEHRSTLRHICSGCWAPLSRTSPSLFHCEKCGMTCGSKRPKSSLPRNALAHALLPIKPISHCGRARRSSMQPASMKFLADQPSRHDPTA